MKFSKYIQIHNHKSNLQRLLKGLVASIIFFTNVNTVFSQIGTKSLTTCYVTGISPTSLTQVSASGGNVSPVIIVTVSEEDCTTYTVTTPSWITYTKGATMISFNAAANTGLARSGTINIGGKSVTVSQAGLAVTISGGATQVCYNTSPGTFTATGSGGTGTYTYLWYKNGTSTGITTKTYTPGLLTSTSTVYCKITSGSYSANSSTTTITVYASLTATISGGTSPLCYNTSPGTFTASGSGGTGTYTYLWYKNGVSTNISTQTYTPGPLTATSAIYCVVTSGICTTNTPTTAITVYSNLIAAISGEITPICYNSNPGTLTATASGGTGSFTYLWYKDGLSTGITTQSYTPGLLTTSSTFYCVVTSGTCGPVNTSTITIIVRENLTAEISGGATTICNNKSPGIITAVGRGGTGTYTFLWYKNGASTDIETQTYEPGKLSSTSTFYCEITSGTCGTVSSNVDTIKVVNLPAADLSKNYIYSVDLNTAIQDTIEIREMSVDSMRQIITYFDGLGRPIQNNTIFGSPKYKDMIVPIGYDEYGREALKYLQYSTTEINQGKFIVNAYSAEDSYYSNDTLFPEEMAYAKTVFESSPLNRVLQQGAPGTAWQPVTGHPVRYDYNANAIDEIRLFRVNADNSISNTGYYPAMKLYKTIIKDENWVDSSGADTLLHTTEEYKDSQGNVVLKRSYVLVETDTNPVAVETYYVYDDLGLLRFVLPPEMSKRKATITTLTQDSLRVKNWCYYYQYDARKRMIVKQLPGADPVYMVYDNRDRLVATQDGKMRSELDTNGKNSWLITKYDELNRPVLTGKYATNVSVTLDSMQTAVNAFYVTSGNLYYTSRTNVSAHQGYDLNSFPNPADTSLIKYYTVTYYDDYNYKGAKSFMSSLSVSDYKDSNRTPIYFNNVKSLVTGSKILVLDGGTTYLTATTYYDDKYRPIEILRDLYEGGSGSEEVTSNMYDFIGQVLQTQTAHTFGSVTTKVNKYYTYDHMGRLLQTEQEIDGDSNGRVALAAMSYDELGQLKQKNLHVNNTDTLQVVDYAYNIRGWLTGINDPENLGTDYFAMELSYNNTTNVGPLETEPQYNGNISGVIWKSGKAANAILKGTGFKYDALNRLIESDYGEGSGFTPNADIYSETIGGYDLNGNILSLTRKDSITTCVSDILSYDYAGAGNQLQKVVDSGDKTRGFIDNANTNIDYDYDSNGNLIQDLNKGISLIKYNYLNLPSEVIKDVNNKIVYIYDATGVKLKKVVTNSGATTSRYYTGLFEYDDNKALVLMHTDEGMVNVSHTGGLAYTYEYHLKDHLGNIRAIAESGNNIPSQLNDYYPFGMLSKSSTTGSTTNKYLYNGKELQDELDLEWYDYGARFYDPQIGRFTTIDPHAENYLSWTPYNYVANNPINLIDLNGMDWYQNENGATMWREGSDAVDGYTNIGANYTQNIGDGVSITYTQNEVTSTTTTVLETDDWASMFNEDGTHRTNSDGKNVSCYQAAEETLNNGGSETAGRSSEVLMTDVATDGRAGTATADASTGIDVINNAVDNGNPIMIGVDYKSGSPNNDQMTDHFIVVSSRTETLSNGVVTATSYNFYDNRTRYESYGTQSSNTLNISNNTLTGTYQQGTTVHNYTVTTVRRNR